MGRKRKHADAPGKETTESKFHFLPPCRICNAAGAGFHYGVNTCEACKGFFHRSFRFHSQYKCQKDNNCKIQHSKGRLCQWCRYQKCLAVGMSKEAIKTGRYTSTKKTGYILEVKKMQDTQNISRPAAPQIDISSTNHSSVTLGDDDSSLQTSSQNAFRDYSYHVIKPETPSSSNSSAFSTPATVRDDSVTSTPLSSPFSEAVLCSHMLSLFQHQDFSPHSCSPPPRNSLYCDNRVTTVSPACSISQETLPHHNSGTYKDVMSEASISSLENCRIPSDNESESQTFPSTLISRQDRDAVMEQFADKDAVLKKLMDSHELAFGRQMSQEEILELSGRHYELAKLRKEMFGKLERLPDEEYDSIFNETGLDADGRQECLLKFGNSLEMCVQRMVQLAKSIPRFSALSMEEKINLIKFSRMEFALISNSVNMNPELGVLYTMDDHWICVLDMNCPVRCDMMRDYVNISKRFLSLDLCLEERVLLKAISIMAPDRSELTNSPAIHEIHWNLVEIFIDCIAKRHEKPLQFFAKVMDAMIHFRFLEEEIKNFVKCRNFTKYCRLDERPLVKEVLSDIFF